MAQIELIADLLNRAPWLATELYGNTMGSYISAILIVIVVWVVTRGLSWLIRMHGSKLTKKTSSQLDDQLMEVVHRSLTFITVMVVLYVGLLSLNLPEDLDAAAAKIFFVLFTLKVARELDRFSVFFVRSYLEPYLRKQNGIEKSFFDPLAKIAKIVIWILAFLLIAGNLGYNITSLVAGLGVGGLAVALAAQETLSNAFGSLSILSDQPFKTGDYIKVDKVEGTVKSIGLRSTRIETPERRMVSIPNKLTSSAIIENFSKKEEFNVNLVIPISYRTTKAQLKKLTKTLRDILEKDPDVNKENYRVHITGFGDYAMQLTVFYYISDISTYSHTLDIRERVNLSVKESIEAAGIEIPYPTQSLRIHNAKLHQPAEGRQKTH